MEKTFILIDGHAIIHRAYHALPPMTVHDGTMVNAVFGFTSMLLKVLNDMKPDYIAVAFDMAGGTFRDEVYKEYKATRVKADQDLYDQIPLVHDIVTAFNIPIFEMKGFEADDVIGTIVKKTQDTNNKIQSVVVTGDGDMLQLVEGDRVVVNLLRKGISDFQLFDEKAVQEKYGFGPERIVDYKALRGDSSDNIPGVKGIGEKTAKELIEAFGGIESIYKNSERLKDFKIKDSVITKLIDGEADAKMSYELATIRRDVPDLHFELEKCVASEFGVRMVEDILKKFEFYSLLNRIPGYEKSENVKKASNKKVIVVSDNKGMKDFVGELKKEKQFACKEVLSGKDVLISDLIGFVVATEKKSWFVDWKKIGKKEQEEVLKIFEDNKKVVIGHDTKSLVKTLYNFTTLQLYNLRLFDVMIASYLLNSSTRAHDLRAIALRELGEDVAGGSDQATLFGVDPQTVADDLGLMLQIAKKYELDLEKENNRGLFDNMEMALIPVLAEMELNGVAIDKKAFDAMSVDAGKTIASLEKKIWKEAGEEFNVASSTQLRDILFDRMGLPTDGIKKGKTGYSTAASELEKLREYSPIIEMLEEYREVEKLRNTYIDVLPTLVNEKTGRIHTSYNQAVASTGRLSSSDPNLQNIPARTELGCKVRDAFIAEKGHVLISADYSQIELRIVASLAKDSHLIGIFERGEDVHSATAAIVNGVDLKDVTKEMRRSAKAVNFGVLYGQGAFGLARGTGMTQWEAKAFIEKYFENFAGVRTYLDNTKKLAMKDGYVETLFGRRRYIPELASSNFQLRSAGERMAINMPVQGTAADLMKMAMIEVDEKLEIGNWKLGNKVKMILQVHDELVFEVKKGLEDEVSELVKNAMVSVAKLDVPIEVDVHVGERWGELK